MCGILGYYKASGLLKSDIRAVENALATMRHRGPNGDGIVLINSKSGQSWTFQSADLPNGLDSESNYESYEDLSADLIFGHRRLSIFDLSSRGHQPMRDAAGNVISFNGEVYNFFEIREELRGKGYSFETETDTEVVMAAYREWGTKCLSRFNGMWSIILWDAQTKKLWVTNDRIGIKQLYQWGNANEWMLASEIKAIRSLPNFKFKLQHDVAAYFLSNGQIDLGPETALEGVRRLEAGKFRLANPNFLMHCESTFYWDFPREIRNNARLEDAKVELRELLDDAVRLRMRADVPWGTTLSGGLDSSSIVYVASKLRKQANLNGPINTFTAIFPGMNADESAFVREIEKDLGLNAVYTNPMEVFEFDDFERFVRHQDLPIPNTTVYAQWSVMKAVSNSDVTVLLDGQGGDELFGGYHHHFYKYMRSLLLRGKFAAFNSLLQEYADLKGFDPKALKKTIYQDVKLFFKLKLGAKLPGPKVVTDWSAANRLTDVLKLDIRHFVMPSLLRFEDRNSMAFSLEARLPFLDYRIVEFALSLPEELKINKGWQKFILREAVSEMPDSIKWRKDKKGFTTPHADWIAAHREQFTHYAQIGLEAFGKMPWEGKQMEKLDSIEIFRLASLGAWIQLG